MNHLNWKHFREPRWVYPLPFSEVTDQRSEGWMCPNVGVNPLHHVTAGERVRNLLIFSCLLLFPYLRHRCSVTPIEELDSGLLMLVVVRGY